MACLENLVFDSAAEVGVAILVLILGVIAWVTRRPIGPGHEFFVLTHIGLAVWLGTSVLQVASPTAACKITWYTLSLPALTFGTVSWSLFMVEFGPIQVKRVRRWGYPGLAVSTLTMILLAATNGAYEALVHTDTPLSILDNRPSIVPDWGWAFYAMLVHNYVWIVFASVVSVLGFWRASPYFRPLFGNLLMMTMVPVITNAAYLLFGHTIWGVDPTPYAFVLSLVAYGWILINSRLLSVEVVGERHLFREADYPKLIVNRKGEIVSVNSRARELLDGPDSATMQNTVNELATSLPAGREIDAHRHDIIDGRAYRPSILVVDDPVHPERPLLGWTIGMIDVTEEEEVARRLLVAKERAEETVRLQSELVSVISHELRTPLTSIRGTLDLLDAGKLGDIPKTARRGVGIARRNSQRLGKLVDDLLNLHKLEAGHFNLDLEELEVRVVLTAALEDLESYAHQRDVRLVLAEGRQVQVCADTLRLQQVITNVVSNAVKFSNAGDAVRVETVLAGECVDIRVTDTGMGIPAGSEEKVFGRFAQIDSSSARSKEGTGLGMTIAKLMMEQMGGRIFYRSELGHGTTFHIEIPLATRAAEGAAA
ncbi:hypothetical protein EU805_16740 [Salipiger sp. IMCC34102]|uniref:sensor histidine kinase n=1 Tax=Salipiger sp. IMCC34102 TaxID=2510647 RepID=UPI00101D3A34|nr:histidine kinase N-terminal 7TM domain-containing protein [Salipiger sp. IMCC34102]RYH00764.1 hypothetical protein EU805_16740 [Salipiger sp. IMCC34102]